MPQTVDFSDALVPKASPMDFSDALVKSAPTQTDQGTIGPGPGYLGRAWNDIKAGLTAAQPGGELTRQPSVLGNVAEAMGGIATGVTQLGLGTEAMAPKAAEAVTENTGTTIAKILKAMKFNKAANYFSEDVGGGYIPTPRTSQIAQLHELTGVKANDLNIPIGSLHPDSVYGTPAEGLLDAGIKPQDLQGLTSEAKIAKINPAWQKAGQAVDAQAATATKKGITLDVHKGISKTIDDMLDPDGSKALARAVDIGKQIGIEDFRSVTPEQAVAYKRALWEGLPSKFRNPLYAAVMRDLNAAVPEMKPTNLAYTQLRRVMDGLGDLRNIELTKAGPTKFEQMLELMKRHPYATGAIPGAAGIGELAREGVSIYRGMRGDR
jgi:hypothetical protein